jgi:hypothetical protein
VSVPLVAVAPLPVFGAEIPAPAPPRGLVALGANGTGVFVDTAVGGGGAAVFVAGTVAVTAGVAERTMVTGVNVGVGENVAVGVHVAVGATESPTANG